MTVVEERTNTMYTNEIHIFLSQLQKPTKKNSNYYRRNQQKATQQNWAFDLGEKHAIASESAQNQGVELMFNFSSIHCVVGLHLMSNECT